MGFHLIFNKKFEQAAAQLFKLLLSDRYAERKFAPVLLLEFVASCDSF